MIYYFLCCLINVGGVYEQVGFQTKAMQALRCFVFFVPAVLSVLHWDFTFSSICPLCQQKSNIYAPTAKWPEYQQIGDLRTGISPCLEGFVPFHKEDYCIGPSRYSYFRNHWTCAMGVGIHPVEMRALRRFVFFVPVVLFCFSPVWVLSADLH